MCNLFLSENVITVEKLHVFTFLDESIYFLLLFHFKSIHDTKWMMRHLVLPMNVSDHVIILWPHFFLFCITSPDTQIQVIFILFVATTAFYDFVFFCFFSPCEFVSFRQLQHKLSYLFFFFCLIALKKKEWQCQVPFHINTLYIYNKSILKRNMGFLNHFYCFASCVKRLTSLAHPVSYYLQVPHT